MNERRFALAILIACVAFADAVAWVARSGPDDVTFTRTVAAAATTVPVPTTTAATLPDEAPARAAAAAAPAPRPPSSDGGARDRRPVERIGTIEIPRIGLVHAVYEGNTLTQIDHGPSHWPGSALPGRPGNAVFAGHRVTHSHPFRHIDRLQPGDRVHFTIHGVRSTYAVTGHQVVTPKDVWIIDPTPTATATLFACHPPGSARYRYVVRLALVPGE